MSSDGELGESAENVGACTDEERDEGRNMGLLHIEVRSVSAISRDRQRRGWVRETDKGHLPKATVRQLPQKASPVFTSFPDEHSCYIRQMEGREEG